MAWLPRLTGRWAVTFIAAAAGVLFYGGPSTQAAADPPRARLRFSPGPGTPDYLRLFERPEEWPRARQLIGTFKFYNQHTLTPAPSIVGPNTYDALVRADAFRKLRRWGIRTALEIGSVKEFFCPPESGGMDASVRNTIAGVNAILAAGGVLDYIAMDEPWVSGRTPICGGRGLEPTADRVAVYMNGVQRAFPRTQIGLIEAYPFSTAAEIETMLQLMAARGVPPAFLHMDVDWHSLGPGDFARDMRRLQAACDARRIPFGIIIVGYNGEADALYAVDAGGMANLIAEAFASWDAMPDHIIFQSWVVTSTGLFITPTNVPEDRLHTHTSLIRELFRRLRGATGGPTGRAVRRR